MPSGTYRMDLYTIWFCREGEIDINVNSCLRKMVNILLMERMMPAILQEAVVCPSLKGLFLIPLISGEGGGEGSTDHPGRSGLPSSDSKDQESGGTFSN